MKNVLLIAPHPDDELVGATFIIKKVLFKTNLIIFFPTNGVISKEEMWLWEKKNYKLKLEQRINEMKRSLKHLGIKKFYVQDIPTRKLKTNINKTFLKIKEIIKRNRIDTLFCPAFEGGHQDHDVINFICSRFKNNHSVYEFAEYNFFKNRINCNEFIKETKNQKTLVLSSNEKKEKKKLLNIYYSEKGNLDYLAFDKETYRKIFNYDYSLPPHPGRLFYRRFSFFSWHPRVDSDKPEDITNEIMKSEIY